MAREIWKLGPSVEFLSLSELQAKSDQLRQRAKGESLDAILPEAYALVREMAYRILNMRPYDVQIMGAIALHEGRITEMSNGEGKTLVATLPVYLNCLSGQGVHVATYNDYLARRDALWMGPLYAALGLTVGVIQLGSLSYRLEQIADHYQLIACERKAAYDCDVTYGTHQEFVFDYLRDNLVLEKEELVQDQLDYIILDEADSVLIDLARGPKNIPEYLEYDPNFYRKMMTVAKSLLQNRDYILIVQYSAVELTYEGICASQNLLGIEDLYSVTQAGVAQQLIQSLQALHYYKPDREYIVDQDTIVVIDQYTGRRSPGGLFPNGLHQAIQAKEQVSITPEQYILATISFQRFFPLYKKMAGMTATAKWREDELQEVYNAKVVVIPPNNELHREELTDRIYQTKEAQFDAIIAGTKEINDIGRPVLIGTQTIEEAEKIRDLLADEGIEAQVLHAKNDEHEARIIAAAGRKGAVTIAAKMAGRGTDILLGGNPEDLSNSILEQQGITPAEATNEQQQRALDEARRITQAEGAEVRALGGLHVIGVDRNEARHIDMQLVGRAGRQGDPGSARFLLSLESNVMLRFGRMDIIKVTMDRLGLEDDTPIDAKIINRSIEGAQGRLEERYFKQRREAYEFDGVLDKQRQLIYSLRRKAVYRERLDAEINIIIDNIVSRSMERYMPDKRRPGTWDVAGLSTFFSGLSNRLQPDRFAGLRNQTWEDIKKRLLNTLVALYEERKKTLGGAFVHSLERYTLLEQLDSGWEDHLRRLEELQQEMQLRTHVEEGALDWYVVRSNQAFWDMLERAELAFLNVLLNFKVWNNRETVTYNVA
jgi:preprotein translocase subunit SecA